MRRPIACFVLTLVLGGCPTYDRYSEVVDQKGLLSADEFAKYGPEQAQKVAIGRKFAQEYRGRTHADIAQQVGAAVEYAKTLPDVADVRADTAAYFLTVTFKSGWRTFVLPLDDGKAPEATPGLTKAAAAK